MKVGIFLDIDGVCTQEPVNLQYARLLGVEQQQLELEKAFASEKISTEEFGDKLVELFRAKQFTHEWAKQNFANIRLKLYYEKLLSLFPEKDVYIVSSSPSYFIEPLAEKFKIPHVLCSRYEFDAGGIITRCAEPVSSIMKKNFVTKYKAQYDVTVGIGDIPKLDGAFLNQCDFSMIMGHYTEEHLKVDKFIDPIIDFLTSLKRIMEYSEIAEVDQTRFAAISKSSQDLLHESNYNRNVFIMTSFRDDARYRETIQTIRQILNDSDFHGWLASDKNLDSQLWANVQAFMLACKYGIAIFTREEEGKGTTVKIKTSQFNPNVSIELGFMLSRGKEVLILKDKVLKRLPTDMMGSLYHDFDLDSPQQSLASIVENWIKDILSRETE